MMPGLWIILTAVAVVVPVGATVAYWHPLRWLRDRRANDRALVDMFDAARAEQDRLVAQLLAQRAQARNESRDAEFIRDRAKHGDFVAVGIVEEPDKLCHAPGCHRTARWLVRWSAGPGRFRMVPRCTRDAARRLRRRSLPRRCAA